MRFKITFQLEEKPQVLPLNYKYPVSSWIYKTLASADKEFTTLLHEHGYQLENGKQFKLFTFSDLQVPKGTWKVMADRMQIWADTVSLVVSFMLPEQVQYFVAGLFQNQQVRIGDQISQVHMTVQNIEAVKVEIPDGNTHQFRWLSPIFVEKKVAGRPHPLYITPADEDYADIFIRNLMDKYTAHCRKTGTQAIDINRNEIQFKSLNEKPIRAKQTIKAFTKEQTELVAYKFNFELTAPKEILEIGLHAGFGSENAQGFGCCEIIGEERRDRRE